MSAPPSLGPTQSYIYINSLDRYPNGIPPRDPAQQTSSTDMTFSLPGLADISTVSLQGLSFLNGFVNSFNNWNVSSVNPDYYTNIINLVDYTAGTTTLITFPVSGVNLLGTALSSLGQPIGAAYGQNATVTIPIVMTASTLQPICYNPIGSAQLTGLSYISWYDQINTPSHSIGWAPVTIAPDGTDITNRRQLYDFWGLQGHTPSIAGAGINGSGIAIQPKYTGMNIQPFLNYESPQLQNFAPDVATSYTPPNGSILRVQAPSTTWAFGVAPNSQLSKVMKVVPGSKTLQIKMTDWLGNPFTSKFTQPVPYNGSNITGTGIQNTTTSNITLSGITNANTLFTPGKSFVNIVTGVIPSGWRSPVYALITAVTSNSITIPYITSAINSISNATTAFTMRPIWQHTSVGNANSLEYQMVLLATANKTV